MPRIIGDADGTLDVLAGCHSKFTHLSHIADWLGSGPRHRRADPGSSNGDFADLLARCVPRFNSTKENVAAAAGACAIEVGMWRRAAGLCATNDEAVPGARCECDGLARHLRFARANAIVLGRVSDAASRRQWRSLPVGRDAVAPRSWFALLAGLTIMLVMA